MKRESALVVALCLVGGFVLLGYAISSRQQRPGDAGVPGPSISEANPGVVGEDEVEFEREGRRRTEEFGVVRSAAGVLEELGHSVTSFETWLQHGDSGLVLHFRLVDAQPFEGGGVRTVTAVQSTHPELIPRGVFEYQHSRYVGLAIQFVGSFVALHWIYGGIPSSTCPGASIPGCTSRR